MASDLRNLVKLYLKNKFKRIERKKYLLKNTEELLKLHKIPNFIYSNPVNVLDNLRKHIF